MAQIYDRFQIDNGHLFAQLIADTLLTRSFKALNRTVVIGYIEYRNPLQNRKSPLHGLGITS